MRGSVLDHVAHSHAEEEAAPDGLELDGRHQLRGHRLLAMAFHEGPLRAHQLAPEPLAVGALHSDHRLCQMQRLHATREVAQHARVRPGAAVEEHLLD